MSKPDEKKVEEKNISRRNYLKYAGAGVVVVAVAGAGAYYATQPAPTPIQTQTQTATQVVTSVVTASPTQSPTGINAIANVALNAAGQNYSGTSIKILGEAPFWQSLIGKVSPFWTSSTGVPVAVDGVATFAMRDKALTEITAHSGYYDIIGSWYANIYDFIAAGGLEPLEPYIQKYYPNLFTDGPPYGFTPMQLNRYPGVNAKTYNGHIYAIVSDGDPWIMYYRKDLYTDPAEMAAFNSKYGYALAAPQTFDQWRDQLEFWRRKSGDKLAGKTLTKDFYGGAYMEGRYFANMTYLTFFFGYGGVPFDPDTMTPLINQQEGLKALNKMIELNKFLPADVSTYDYTAANNLFAGGQAASFISWGISGKALNSPAVASPEVYGNIGYSLLPGAKQGDYTIRNVQGFTQTPGVNQRARGPIHPAVMTMSSDSKNKDLAFLFMLWVLSPSISMSAVFDPSGSWDPYRYCHFDANLASAALKEGGNLFDPAAYKKYLEVQWASQGTVSPDIALQQGAVYQDKLDIQIGAAISGTTDAQTALNNVAKDWETITNTVGRDTQKSLYQVLYPLYVSPVPDEYRVVYPF
jgi:multiple sugar transport system substrate-binding protein